MLFKELMEAKDDPVEGSNALVALSSLSSPGIQFKLSGIHFNKKGLTLNKGHPFTVRISSEYLAYSYCSSPGAESRIGRMAEADHLSSVWRGASSDNLIPF